MFINYFLKSRAVGILAGAISFGSVLMAGGQQKFYGDDP